MAPSSQLACDLECSEKMTEILGQPIKSGHHVCIEGAGDKVPTRGKCSYNGRVLSAFTHLHYLPIGVAVFQYGLSVAL